MADLSLGLTCNITDPNSCGNGECRELHNQIQCVCFSKWEPVTNCSTLISRDVKYASIPVDAFSFIAYLFFGVLVTLEIVIDFRRQTHRRVKSLWRNPMMIMKFFYVLFCLVTVVRMGYEIHQDSTDTIYPAVVQTVYIGIASSFLTASFILGVIAWTTLLEKVRNLSNNIRFLKVFRIVAWILVLVIYPLQLVLYVLQLLKVGDKVLSPLAYAVATIMLLPMVVGSVFLLIRVIVWGRKQQRGPKKSKTLAKALTKSLWLGLAALGYVLILGRVVVGAVNPVGSLSAWGQFLWSLPADTIPGLVISLGLFMFLQNYFLYQNKYFHGYRIFFKTGNFLPATVSSSRATAGEKSASSSSPSPRTSAEASIRVALTQDMHSSGISSSFDPDEASAEKEATMEVVSDSASVAVDSVSVSTDGSESDSVSASGSYSSGSGSFSESQSGVSGSGSRSGSGSSVSES